MQSLLDEIPEYFLRANWFHHKGIKRNGYEVFHTVTNIWYYFAGLHDICIMGEAASAASTTPQYSQLQVTGKVLPNVLSLHRKIKDIVHKL